MAETTWNTTTINGKQYLVIDSALFRIPLDWDPSSNMFIAVAANSGGYGNFPALVKGDTGDTPTFDEAVNLTVLDYDDPTADSVTLTDLGGNVYQANMVIHQGPQGDPGTAVLGVNDYGTPVAGNMLVVNATADDFEYSAQMCGDRYVPASINSTPAGNPTYTLAAISIPPQSFDWRPDVSGQAVITPTGQGNCVVDLVARLNDASSGNIVGRGFGAAFIWGTAQNQVVVPGPPAGSTDAYDRVSAGGAAVVYLRAERASGTDTFTTSNATTSFSVKVRPIAGTGT